MSFTSCTALVWLTNLLLHALYSSSKLSEASFFYDLGAMWYFQKLLQLQGWLLALKYVSSVTTYLPPTVVYIKWLVIVVYTGLVLRQFSIFTWLERQETVTETERSDRQTELQLATEIA